MKNKIDARINQHVGGVLSRSKLYIFELLMSIIGLTVTAFVVDYGIFSIFSHVAKTNPQRYDSNGFIVFIVTAMIVWLPVALIFYLRVRGEMNAVSTRGETSMHKVLVSVFMFINIIAAIGALFYAVYMLLQFFLGASNELGNTILRYVLPGVVMALWHGWLFLAFLNTRIVSRKVFAFVVAVMTLAVVVLLFLLTATGIRAQAIDAKREADVSTLGQAVTQKYNSTNELPQSLNELTITTLNNDRSQYAYERVSDTRYTLCTDFAESGDSRYGDVGSRAQNGFTTSPSWYRHESGNHCYKVEIPKKNYDNSSYQQ